MNNISDSMIINLLLKIKKFELSYINLKRVKGLKIVSSNHIANNSG